MGQPEQRHRFVGTADLAADAKKGRVGQTQHPCGERRIATDEVAHPPGVGILLVHLGQQVRDGARHRRQGAGVVEQGFELHGEGKSVK
ncbi:hypothetical protein D9M69_698810 [compost metagenome]